MAQNRLIVPIRPLQCSRRFTRISRRYPPTKTSLIKGPLARRISTYKIGAFLLAGCGATLAPIVAATAELPIMAIPGSYNKLNLSVVLLAASIPLFGYHFLTRRYVLSMHIFVPPQKRTDLRTFTTYLNDFQPGTILRFRTFRMIFGVKSEIVPIEELRLVKVTGNIQSLEKNVEWVGSGFRKTKAWYLQPGLGGLEMDSFWKRIGMKVGEIKLNRDKAVAQMKEISRKRVQGMKDAVRTYEGNNKKRVKKMSIK